MTEFQSFCTDTIQSFYNQPTYSDGVLVFNGIKYFLLLPLVKKYAPLLYAEFEKESNISLGTMKSESTKKVDLNEYDIIDPELLNSLSALVSKTYHKKVVTICEPAVSVESVDAVLGSIYGKPLDLMKDNLSDVYLLSTKFGICVSVTKCTKFFKQLVRLDSLMDEFDSAMKTNSPLVPMFFDAFIKVISSIPTDKLLEFVSKLDATMIHKIVTSNDIQADESLIYEMVHAWWKEHNDSSRSRLLMSHVKLELLSVDVLTTKCKTNPLINSDAYQKVLETKLLKFSKDDTNGRRCMVANDSMELFGSHMFALGKFGKSYPGYHWITSQEIQSRLFHELFKKQYLKMNGMYCLDDMYADIVCCMEGLLRVKGVYWIRLESGIELGLKKNTTVHLCASRCTEKEFIANIDSIQVCDDTTSSAYRVGLFISNNLKLA